MNILTWRMVCAQYFRIAAPFAFFALSYKLTSFGAYCRDLVVLCPLEHARGIQLLGVVCALFSIWVVRNMGPGSLSLFPFSGWGRTVSKCR